MIGTTREDERDPLQAEELLYDLTIGRLRDVLEEDDRQYTVSRTDRGEVHVSWLEDDGSGRHIGVSFAHRPDQDHEYGFSMRAHAYHDRDGPAAFGKGAWTGPGTSLDAFYDDHDLKEAFPGSLYGTEEAFDEEGSYVTALVTEKYVMVSDGPDR